MTVYTANSGDVVRIGLPSTFPSWHTSEITSDNTWTSLPGTNFQTWGAANMPAGAYIGTDPIGAIVDAYCDPATGFIGGVPYQWFYGGGHGDGTNNAVVRFNWQTLTYGMAVLPTPPDKYPPDYGSGRFSATPPGTATQPGPLRYPSGLTPGRFSTDLTDPLDTPYNAPFMSRPSTHMYDTAVYTPDGKINYFYANDAVFNTTTGQWEQVNTANYGAQLNALSASFGSGGFNTQGSFKYDAVTDKFWGTLVPGDGVGFRSHMVRIDRATRVIEAAIDIDDSRIGNGSTLVQVGRWLYSFKATQSAYDQPASFNTGFRILMDAPYTVEAINCTGVLAPAYSLGGGFETMPSTYDAVGNRIVRANYSAASSIIYEINPIPVSGAGTLGDPRLLTQTSRTLTNTIGSAVQYPYSRAFFYPGTRILCLLPIANTNARAVRLS
jgi:hypothetical protein